MTDRTPLLSVIIPVYNAEATLARTLASLLRIAPEHQSQVQVIIVNDGSRDRSLELARQFANQSAFFQWDLIDQPNRGVSAARNAGLERVRGQWIFFLDGDDELALDPLP